MHTALNKCQGYMDYRSYLGYYRILSRVPCAIYIIAPAIDCLQQKSLSLLTGKIKVYTNISTKDRRVEWNYTVERILLYR